MDSMANAFSLSCLMVFLRKVFTLFKVETHLSASAVVMMIFKRVIVSEKSSSRLFYINIWNRFIALKQALNSSLLYMRPSSVFSSLPFSIGLA